jgi:hypothetical protein
MKSLKTGIEFYSLLHFQCPAWSIAESRCSMELSGEMKEKKKERRMKEERGCSVRAGQSIGIPEGSSSKAEKILSTEDSEGQEVICPSQLYVFLGVSYTPPL